MAQNCPQNKDFFCPRASRGSPGKYLLKKIIKDGFNNAFCVVTHTLKPSLAVPRLTTSPDTKYTVWAKRVLVEFGARALA